MPDLGVTCAPPRGTQLIADPILLIEILSPSNAASTRANVWAYCTIGTVREVLLLSSTSIRAELLRRDDQGAWPNMPLIISDDEALHLDSIGFAGKLSAFYAGTSLIV